MAPFRSLFPRRAVVSARTPAQTKILRDAEDDGLPDQGGVQRWSQRTPETANGRKLPSCPTLLGRESHLDGNLGASEQLEGLFMH
ncbi:hypothetical protein Q31a_60930 [Aureliella helgolandensis]|uniref:Uncharacterized protein n=1 Tax=Aureliella helgolandensis TaxID=2527968 RepID=A0A518GGJ3_9BACT|nr:hypothetical protein Q31a_60930 [Aureliella helgolandensis]